MKIVSAASLPPDGEPALAEIDGVQIPVHYRAGSTDTLIILFHGAVDQKVRPKPHFQPLFPHVFGAHQLAVSDTCLIRSDELKLSWYLGTDDLPLPALLEKYFKLVSQAGKFKRVIFFGASGGGHAALYHSYKLPGSLAIAVNAQVDLMRYHASALIDYQRYCWPGVSSIEDLRPRAPLDLPDLYSSPMQNFVCLLNSAGDRQHVFDHSFALLSRIPRVSQNRVVFHADYYGVLGHAVSVPYKSCVPWIKASVYSPNLFADSLLKKLQQFRGTPAQARPVAAGPMQLKSNVSDEDLRVADALCAFQLRESP
ncbi:hypothetical protein [uncultured Piscinibacter sp.]|uniref:hypothetical protein n=1 Tax=uncultured Piscinibacter sp. TaxID=1131835 RepID=UPI002623C3F2|nr:hypothetical protein [uncultured Piscinibacter sp.]